MTERDRDQMAPGDEAPPGEDAVAGENVCPECSGSGRVEGATCEHCAGTGTVIEGTAGS